jgi:UDP-2-acetamido-3-amino-2,3-dideoxy-glucuronate N-acetyltransferase
MSKDVLNVAVVGAGYWGKNLVRNFATAPRCVIKYVCDLNPEVLAAHKRSFPSVEITPNVAAVLDDPQVQAVVIATPVPAHFEIARNALLAGKHVYVEKPLTLQAAQARQLIESATKTGLKLMVGHLLEYHPAVIYLKEMLDRGQLGEPYYLYTQRVNLGIVRQNENA